MSVFTTFFDLTITVVYLKPKEEAMMFPTHLNMQVQKVKAL